MSNDKNILWVDFIKVFATFSVVILHSAAPLLYKYNDLPVSYWWIGNIYDSIVRMCVPLFFMLSGYLLLGKTENLKTFFAKRVNKVFIPLVVWTEFYIIWRIYYDKDLSISLSFHSFYEIISTPVYYHLWFLYAILGAYLYVPILRVFVQNAHRNILYYFITLWILVASVIPLLEKLTGIYGTGYLAMLSGYAGYLVIGYLLGQREYSNKIFITAILVALICIMVTALGTFYLTVQGDGKLDGYFYGYLSPNVILLSVSTFIILKQLVEKLNILKNKSTIRIIQILSLASLGIYLIHPVFLDLLGRGDLGISVSAFSGNPFYFVPITAILVFTLSFIVTIILQRIPIVNRCVP